MDGGSTYHNEYAAGRVCVQGASMASKILHQEVDEDSSDATGQGPCGGGPFCDQLSGP
jgi:hypothetical protein